MIKILILVACTISPSPKGALDLNQKNCTEIRYAVKNCEAKASQANAEAPNKLKGTDYIIHSARCENVPPSTAAEYEKILDDMIKDGSIKVGQ